MPIILIRRTNYPLKGEGTYFYGINGKVEIEQDKWIRRSKTWHLGPFPGGTFWKMFPNRWVKHPQATWIKLLVTEDTFNQYDLWVRKFSDGAFGGSEGWYKLKPREYSPRDFIGDIEFYLVER